MTEKNRNLTIQRKRLCFLVMICIQVITKINLISNGQTHFGILKVSGVLDVLSLQFGASASSLWTLKKALRNIFMGVVGYHANGILYSTGIGEYLTSQRFLHIVEESVNIGAKSGEYGGCCRSVKAVVSPLLVKLGWPCNNSKHKFFASHH